MGSQASSTHCKFGEVFHICKSGSFDSPVASSVQLHRRLLGHIFPVRPAHLSGNAQASMHGLVLQLHNQDC